MGCTLTCEYLRKFVKKFETVQMGYDNDTGGKLPPVSMTPVANKVNNIRLLRP